MWSGKERRLNVLFCALAFEPKSNVVPSKPVKCGSATTSAGLLNTGGVGEIASGGRRGSATQAATVLMGHLALSLVLVAHTCCELRLDAVIPSGLFGLLRNDTPGREPLSVPAIMVLSTKLAGTVKPNERDPPKVTTIPAHGPLVTGFVPGTSNGIVQYKVPRGHSAAEGVPAQREGPSPAVEGSGALQAGTGGHVSKPGPGPVHVHVLGLSLSQNCEPEQH